MYVCQKQEAVITVVPTSRHGVNYDIVRVNTTFLMDEPFPIDEVIFVPGKELIPEELLKLINNHGFDFGPKLSKDVTSKIGDFTQEVQDPNRRDETRKDALLGFLISYMDSIRLEPVAGNLYSFAYEFKLFPDENHNFEFKTTLPFAGLADAGNIDIQLMMVLPNGVTFDPMKTKGIAINGTEINEQPLVTESGRNILSFYYKQDPDFYVSYKYN